MPTMIETEDRLRRTLQAVADSTPISDWQPLLNPRTSPPVQRRPLVIFAVSFIAVVIVGGVSMWAMSTTPDDDLVGPGTTVQISQPVPPSDPEAGDPETPASSLPTTAPPQVTVTEVEAPLLNEEGPPEESVQAMLATTGKTYDELPGGIQDGTVKDSRVVITGDEESSGAIWYSDGGGWTRASIAYPSDTHIGEQVGDYFLADGIRDVIATTNGFLAWTPVFLVTSQPVGSEGSLVEPAGMLQLTSSDGASWTATRESQQLDGIIEWHGGYLNIVAEFDDVAVTNPRSEVLWSSDLNTWTQIAEFDDGYAYRSMLVEGSVVIGVHYWTTDVDSDGNRYIVPSTEPDRWFEIKATR